MFLFTTHKQVLQEDAQMLCGSNADDPQQKRVSQYYVPDFSLRVDDRCVYLKIDRDLWRNGVIKSNYERVNNHLSDSIEYIPSEDLQQSLLGGIPSSMNDLTSPPAAHNSPHRQVYLKKFKDVGHLAPPMAGPLGARRSTITVSVLNKAQDLAKSFTKLSQSKLANDTESSKHRILEGASDEEMVDDRSDLLAPAEQGKLGRSFIVNSDNSVNNNNTEEQSEGHSRGLLTVDGGGVEKEPFINRSTFSLNVLSGGKDNGHHSHRLDKATDNKSLDEKTYQPDLSHL
jgi:hypothetical protein